MKITKNRKMTRRKGISEEVPTFIEGISPNLDFLVPDDEGMDDQTIFSDLLDEAEDIPEEQDDEDERDDEQEEDAEMVHSSGDDDDAKKRTSGEDQDDDDPRGEEKEDEPEAKKRRLISLIESISTVAQGDGICLACGSAEHSMSECENQEGIQRINSAFDDIKMNIKIEKQSFPRGRRSNQEKKNKEKRVPTDAAPDRIISLYPEEIQAFTICADYQAGHWPVFGKHMNDMGPSSHREVVNEILPGMDELDRDYQPNGSVDVNEDTQDFYVNIEQMYHVGKLRMVPRNGVRYWHQDYDDPRYLAPYSNEGHVDYPQQNSPEYKAGGALNYALRHNIGRKDEYNRIIGCNQGAWVLIEDLLQIDYLWRDHENYSKELALNPQNAVRIKKARIGLVVNLTLAEYRIKGKSRFQILGLKADDEQSLNRIISEYDIKRPTPYDKPLGDEYDGWIMPIAMRATSGHSEGMRFQLDPYMMMRRLDLKTALRLQGGYHVTSPSVLKSILENGVIPGGTQGKRLSSYFGVFPPWGRRNRSARTRSPTPNELWMLMIYIPPSELSRFDAGLSGSGDIVVPQTIPPEEIRETWIARNCSAEIDHSTGEKRYVTTTPRRYFPRNWWMRSLHMLTFRHWEFKDIWRHENRSLMMLCCSSEGFPNHLCLTHKI